jgi:hypothetical protein
VATARRIVNVKLYRSVQLTVFGCQLDPTHGGRFAAGADQGIVGKRPNAPRVGSGVDPRRRAGAELRWNPDKPRNIRVPVTPFETTAGEPGGSRPSSTAPPRSASPPTPTAPRPPACPLVIEAAIAEAERLLARSLVEECRDPKSDELPALTFATFIAASPSSPTSAPSTVLRKPTDGRRAGRVCQGNPASVWSQRT